MTLMEMNFGELKDAYDVRVDRLVRKEVKREQNQIFLSYSGCISCQTSLVPCKSSIPGKLVLHDDFWIPRFLRN